MFKQVKEHRVGTEVTCREQWLEHNIDDCQKVRD